MFWRQIDHFVHSIQSGVKPDVGGEDGRATLAAVEAAYESQRTGQKVVVNS
jgi:predicted dehydrogenase